jgi:uncharacterized NAD(P)/FAD-binding protein YdhS
MKVAIIGGGLSGTTAAIYLIKKTNYPVEIVLFEKAKEKLCRGVAYSSELSYQLLNVPVKGMSLFIDEPQHFLNWLTNKGLNHSERDFVSRKLYGDYIKEVFTQTINTNERGGFNVVHDEVTNIKPQENKLCIQTNSETISDFDKVIICTGNFPPCDVPGISPEIINNANYISDPWSGDYIKNVSATDTVFIAGTGLTMVDQVMSLVENENYKGKIIALSRRGFLPLPHGDAPKYELSVLPNFKTITMYDLYYWFKDEINQAEAQGANFISVFDAIRTHLPTIWMDISSKEKACFLRHLRPFWEIHRHRIPKESRSFLQNLITEGRLEVLAGRIKHISLSKKDDLIIEYTPKGAASNKIINTQWVVSCVGPQSDHKKINSPLYQNLFDCNMAITDNLGLGIKISKELNLLDSEEIPNKHIFVVGPPAKGTFWESTSLNEIRIQTHKLVEHLSI